MASLVLLLPFLVVGAVQKTRKAKRAAKKQAEAEQMVGSLSHVISRGSEVYRSNVEELAPAYDINTDSKRDGQAKRNRWGAKALVA